MNIPYKNIITDKIVSFARYIILAEYETKEEAENNLQKDVEEWKEKYKHEAWYKLSYPFAWATIKEQQLAEALTQVVSAFSIS